MAQSLLREYLHTIIFQNKEIIQAYMSSCEEVLVGGVVKGCREELS